MKILMIGGTGTISLEITRLAAQQPGWEVFLLNRGRRGAQVPPNVQTLIGDMNDEAAVKALLAPHRFDVVADFIAFTPEEAARDVRLFGGRTGQYIFISSASAYQKPVACYPITESTPLCNPYWQYSRDKIACEELLLREYRENGFPVTIVRPSHTYDARSLPLALHGKQGGWQTVLRMKAGKPVIVHGDGTSLWTLTHSRDFAKGFLGLMGNPHALGQAVQITSDESLTWNQIYGCLAAALGVEARVAHISSDFLIAHDGELRGTLLGDKANTVIFDCKKLKRLVPGFCATTRYDQGVREVVRHLEATPALQVPDPEFDAWCDRVIARWEAACRG